MRRPIAALVGWHPHSVQRVWSRYRQVGEVALLGRPRGGRRHAHLSPADEAALLAPFVDQATAGGVLVATALTQAYTARVGARVPTSTIYRLLARHGWRTIVPRRRHPDQDPAAPAAFKTNSAR